MGDAPYYTWEEPRYRRLLRQLDLSDLALVLHIGDIFWRPCSDDMYRDRLARFKRLRHPLIYTPGDNEWFDCHEAGSGGYAPQDRLARIRQVFFADASHSLGGDTISLISQAGVAPYGEFVENRRWEYRGMMSATVHLVGSQNGMEPFEGRSAADDAASKRRTEAAAAWVRSTFAAARESNAWAVLIGFHAEIPLEKPADDPERQVFEPFLGALEEEAAGYAGQVLIAHGDGHRFIVDRPLVRRTTGRPLENVTRLEVPGSPDVGWVRVMVTAGSPYPFRFETYIVPRWRMW
jgi:hypothetical protein